MTKEVDDKGYFVTAKHVVVEFTLADVSGLSLNGFNHQNVIVELIIEKTDSGVRLTLDECYGLAGSIEASEMSIRLTPGKPSCTDKNGRTLHAGSARYPFPSSTTRRRSYPLRLMGRRELSRRMATLLSLP